MNIGICDDENMLLRELEETCNKFINQNGLQGEVMAYSNGVDLLSDIDKLNVVILDIEMPEVNGFQLARRISEMKQDIFIIFLTNHEEYLFDSFNFRPFGFLIKPLKEEKLFDRLQEVQRRLSEHKKIVVNEISKKCSICLEDILYIESLGDDSCVYMVDSKHCITSQTLKEWQESLPEHLFGRCDRSYIVSYRYIEHIAKDSITLVGGASVRLSVRRKKEITDNYMEYVKNYGNLY